MLVIRIKHFFLVIFWSLSSLVAIAQNGFKVVDGENRIIEKAMVTHLPSNTEILKSNIESFFVDIYDSDDNIEVKAVGYFSKILSVSMLKNLNEVVLLGDKFEVAQELNIPFNETNKRFSTGSVTQINMEDLIEYNNVNNFISAISGKVPSFINENIFRGRSGISIVVDGIPRPAFNLNAEQIESISFVKDLKTSMLYGSQAENGIISIKTKNGIVNEKYFRVSLNNGLSKPIRLPNYLNSADYMELYNEALINDGGQAFYSENEILASRNGSDLVQYPDENYYSPSYINDFTTFHKAVVESSGGNNKAQYYVNLGWNRNRSLLKLGEGKNENQDQLSFQGKASYKLNEIIRVSLDGLVNFSIENGPVYSNSDFWTMASTLKPNLYPILIPVSMVEDKTSVESAVLINDKYILGGTSEYRTNLYGDFLLNGKQQTLNRLLLMNAGLDFNFSSILKGLTGKALLSFDVNNSFTTQIQNAYAVYEPIWFDNSIVKVNKIGQDVKVDNKSVSGTDFYRRIGFFGVLNYQRIFNNYHILEINAIGYRDQINLPNQLYQNKNLHFGNSVNYIYKNKYLIDLTGVLAGSAKLFGSNPYKFSHGMGIGWILSEEEFFKNLNSKLNYLKFSSNYALNYTDQSLGYYQYVSAFTKGNIFSYGQGLYGNNTRLVMSGNNLLDWEKHKQFNTSIETVLFNNKLSFNALYYYHKHSDIVVRRNSLMPVYIPNEAVPYENFGVNKYNGIEIDLKYMNSIGKLDICLGGTFSMNLSSVKELDELLLDEYQTKKNKPVDAIFGYVAEGLFKNQDDILNHSVQTFEDVKPGDIKYKDLNNDGFVNESDQKYIGKSLPKYVAGFNFKLKYKNFDFFGFLTGQFGHDALRSNSYYWVFGERKYSEEVLGRFTGEDMINDATYPRLSVQNFRNNFKPSSYWIYDNSFISLNTLQLTYSLKNNLYRKLPIAEMSRIYLRGNNLYQIAANKDIRELNIGKSPQSRYYSIGIVLNIK